MDLLKEHSNVEQAEKRVQVIMTTHSPSLVSTARIEDMTLVHKAQTFPLAAGKTKLKRTDYSFLRRFIDATKANLFFARGVMMVEGPAEAILVPAIAEMCGRSFSKHGVSMVNVGHTGLYHYARILQREGTGPEIPIPVVCLTDRDIVPNIAKTYVAKPAKGKRFDSDYSAPEMAAAVQKKKERAEGGKTIVCVSDCWTLEFDLALHGCAKLMYVAISLAAKAKSRDERLEDADETATLAEAELSWTSLECAGHTKEELAAIIYKPLQEKDASKAIAAQYAAHLVCTGKYGTGEDLFKALPPYLQAALSHLTIAPAAKPAATAGPGVAVPTALTVPGSAASVPSSTQPPVPTAFPTVTSDIPTVATPQGSVVANAQAHGQAGTTSAAAIVPPTASAGGKQGNGT